MGTLKNKDALCTKKVASTDKGKKPIVLKSKLFNFREVTDDEHKKMRINVYDYII